LIIFENINNGTGGTTFKRMHLGKSLENSSFQGFYFFLRLLKMDIQGQSGVSET
jgi:hypothetical protein